MGEYSVSCIRSLAMKRGTILVLLVTLLIFGMYKMVHPIVTLIAVGIICLGLGLTAGAGGIIYLSYCLSLRRRGGVGEAADEASAIGR